MLSKKFLSVAGITWAFIILCVIVTWTIATISLKESPRTILIAPDTLRVGSDSTGKDSIIVVEAVSLLPRRSTDMVWWTSSDPSRVAVWPVNLKLSTEDSVSWPKPGSARLVSRARVRFVYHGSAQVCAELIRKPTRQEAQEALLADIKASRVSMSEDTLEFRRKVLGLIKPRAVSRDCVEVVSGLPEADVPLTDTIQTVALK